MGNQCRQGTGPCRTTLSQSRKYFDFGGRLRRPPAAPSLAQKPVAPLLLVIAPQGLQMGHRMLTSGARPIEGKPLHIVLLLAPKSSFRPLLQRRLIGRLLAMPLIYPIGFPQGIVASQQIGNRPPRSEVKRPIADCSPSYPRPELCLLHSTGNKK